MQGRPVLNGLALEEPDFEKIWKRNKDVPKPCNTLLHGLFEERVAEMPNAPATCGWDGNFTYGELDKASTALANRLVKAGVAKETMIPICFEKSIWAVVALLGILKAGCAFVPLDPSQPRLRHDRIVAQCSAKVIVTSASCSNLLRDAVRLVTVDRSLLEDKSPTYLPRRISPESPAYVLFTSGSTGEPKGAIMEHRAICTSLKHRAGPEGYTSQSRMLHFASYAFDAIIEEVFMTLSVGGCVCVPSENERLSNLSQSIISLEVNTLGLTPTAARLLDPKDVPDVKTVILWGEAVSEYDITRWGPSCKVTIAYGPTECAVICVHHTVDFQNLPSYGIIGEPITSVCWVVDPDDYNKLLPIGAIGELLIEGYTLARGYLNDPQKTAESFIDDPEWLVQKHGRPGRLYRTGDLVKYSHDGSLSYVARKDTQVKIHGQRVELSEVESCVAHHMNGAGHVVANVVTLSDSNTVLAAFIQTSSPNTIVLSKGNEEMCSLELLLDTADLVGKLSQSLPKYMVPSVFFAVRDLPKTISGKTNRRLLCQSASALTLSSLNQASDSTIKAGPINSKEHTLRQIWAKVLRLDPSKVGMNDSFFRLGGDSIAATKVSNQARKQGIEITVADIIRHPKLGDGAAIAVERHRAQEPQIDSFSLLDGSIDIPQLCSAVAHEYNIDISAIEDILPCTPLQEGLLSLTDRDSGDYMFQFTLYVSDRVDVDRLREAWEAVRELLPILRTRIVSTKENRTYQVVLRDVVRWATSDNLQDYLRRDQAEPMRLGDPLTRYTIVRSVSGKAFLVWTIHHSLYDGWSVQRMLAMVERAYQGLIGLSQPRDFRVFIKYLKGQNNDEARKFWQCYLENCQAPQFPLVHLKKDGTKKNGSGKRDLFEDQRPVKFDEGMNYLPTTFVRAALSVLIGQLNASDEVIFGATIFGRHYPIDDMEDIVGPTIATVPIRANLGQAHTTTISDFLDSLQEQATAMIPYEQFGLQNIMQLSRDCQAACNFQTHLTVQPENYESLKTDTLGRWEKPQSLLTSLNTYPLMIECFLNSTGIRMQVSYDTDVLSAVEVERMVEQFYQALEQLLQADPRAKLRDIRIEPPSNLQQIWSWNATVPPATDGLLHVLSMHAVTEVPNAPAVRGWDRDFTYMELEKASANLASQLVNQGVTPGAAVLLCFEKSAWAIVAMLGILKAGAAFIPLDPSQPALRQQKIIRQSDGRTVITSTSCATHFKENKGVIVLTESILADEFNRGARPKRIQTEDPAYIMFTSGTTGEPKGVVVSHQAICTSIKLRAMAQGFRSHSRVLQFSSYTFDTMIDEIFMTLHVGGCVCVLSDNDRLNNLSSAIAALDVNTIGLTPSVAQLLDPHEVPGVDSVMLWGEPVLHHDVARWSHAARVMVGYGPTECCVLSAHHLHARFRDASFGSMIGKAAASVCWLVDPSDHNRLAPLGAIGELLVEGPALADGYLKDPEKTAMSFIKDPEWLLRGVDGKPGRHGRLYKTGDLVRYTRDGSLCYIGRKDTQIKIHGQRVELGEVEHFVAQFMPGNVKAVAEVVSLGDNAALAVVIQTPRDESTAALNGVKNAPLLEALPNKTDLEEKLSQHLPRYMVPSAFFVVNCIPRMASGKVNRKLIREMITEFDQRRHAAAQDVRIYPIDSMERRLHQIWADVLRLAPEAIDINSNFFRLGGNSIAAMKVSNRARKQGIAITVADMFRHPKLVDSATAAGTKSTAQEVQIPPFSLLDECQSSEFEKLRDEVAHAYNLDPSAIEDILPCTALQEGLLSLTNRDNGDYIVQFVLHVSDSIQMDKLRRAWEKVVGLLPILRTRIVSTKKSKLYQAVVQENISWSEANNLEDYLEHDKSQSMRLGDPLARYATAQNSADDKKYLIWTLHHSLYDGWSAQRMLAMVERAYQGVSLGQPQDFRIFIKYLKDNNNQEAEKFWKSHLAGCQAPKFPTAHLKKNSSRKRELFEAQRPIAFNQGRCHLPGTFIRAAMSILISRLTVSNEVIFGGTIFGRHYAIDGIEDIIGPTIASVPIRIKLEEGQTVSSFLDSLQAHATEMIPYEQFGIQNIARLSRDCQAACNFQTHLTIQPEEYQSVNTDSLGTWHRPSGLLTSLNTYPLMIECFLNSAGLRTQVNFDTTVISASEIKRTVDQFHHTLEQLMQADISIPVKDIQIEPPSNSQQIWAWNKTVPEQVNDLLHGLFERKAVETPDALAIHGWDGDFTYGQLDKASMQLASQLTAAGLACGTAVPMCVEKSIWAVVAMLGILKAGGVFVPIDSAQPGPRREKIIKETGGQIIVTSASCSGLFKSSDRRQLIIAGASSVADSLAAEFPLRNIPPGSPAYIMFTSGSTGEPKGVVVEHSAICTSIIHRAPAQGYGPNSRMLQFASYTFDAMIDEIFMTLFAGGCICMPSEEERASLSRAIVDLEANSLCLTPTVSRLIDPTEVPGIESVILWGEPVLSHDIAWWKHVPRIMVGYGPTECCVVCTHSRVDPQNLPLGSVIGKAAGSTTWIVDAHDHNQLAPIGAIGELMIEGHALARGYLNDAQKTSTSFIQDPDWLIRGAAGHTPGRHGRLYKTGDLVRYNDDGSLTYIGRKDNQVKINGQRVELGEVESYMVQCVPEADRVVADVVTFSDGNTALVAFIEMKRRDGTAKHLPARKKASLRPIRNPTGLTKRLFGNLPRHMVPSVSFAVEEIPETISGKVNRPKRSPTNIKEEKLQQIWADILRLEPSMIGMDDSFFRLGGNSIAAMKVSAAARQIGWSLPVSAIFRSLNIATLCAPLPELSVPGPL
ncbi:AMP-dependent synthetase/ligase [Macrophomina phaseolina MS6]|uniref:AMP-dependent synthetase/ligase n=1 Tax=Macrophomina phaseolina (strain MS6) TaxID=1126212 RepID=K2SSN8_MACPH|nr:AMP-dependent synthetase/ligase [Macrophomina phaseolina MS6]